MGHGALVDVDIGTSAIQRVFREKMGNLMDGKNWQENSDEKCRTSLLVTRSQIVLYFDSFSKLEHSDYKQLEL